MHDTALISNALANPDRTSPLHAIPIDWKLLMLCSPDRNLKIEQTFQLSFKNEAANFTAISQMEEPVGMMIAHTADNDFILFFTKSRLYQTTAEDGL